MVYDIEADWMLLLTCNFRCPYCFIDPKLLGAKIVRHGTPEQWRDGFARTGKTWLLHMSGGEPAVHPDFVELARLLSREHYLSLNSNLSHRNIDAFADAVDPARVHYINASLHYDERAARGGLEDFITRALRLKSQGFNVMVSQVVDPAVLPRLEGIMDTLAERGLTVFPKALRDTYRGSVYPRAYTVSERTLMTRLIEKARAASTVLRKRIGEAPTINLFEEELQLEPANYRGRWCAAGPRFVQIDEQGLVLRCGSPVSYGSILRGNVALPQDIRRCKTDYCPYYCEKYSVAMSEPGQASAAREALMVPAITRL